MATSLGQKGVASKFFLLVFGWCGTPSVSYRLQRHLTNSQTVLPLFPKTKRNLLVSFNGAGIVLELPLCAGEVVWRCCGLTIHYSRQKVIRRRRRNGTVEKSNARPTVFRPLCEDRSNVGRQLYFFKIAARSAFRNTLKTVESLEWRASARPRARLWRREQRVLAKACASEWKPSLLGFCNERSQVSLKASFSRVPISLVLSVAQKVRKAKSIIKLLD